MPYNSVGAHGSVREKGSARGDVQIEFEIAPRLAILRYWPKDTLLRCVFCQTRKIPSNKSEFIMMPERIIVHHLKIQKPTQTAEQNKLGLLPMWVPCVLLPMCALECGVVVEADSNIRIRFSTTKLVALETLSGDDRHLQYADGSIEWNAGHELFEVEREDIRVVHHGAEGSVDHVVNEGRKTGDLDQPTPPFSSRPNIGFRVTWWDSHWRCQIQTSRLQWV